MPPRHIYLAISITYLAKLIESTNADTFQISQPLGLYLATSVWSCHPVLTGHFTKM